MERFNPDGLVYSEGYARTMDEVVTPYLAARRRDMTVPGYEGRPLFVSRFDADAPRGTVLVVHGFTECADKFAEVIHSLLRNGMSVVAYDQRGHGRSWRAEGVDDISLTHVDRFDEYVEDMNAVCARVLSEMPKPWRVFCHSMGGAVTALFLERAGEGGFPAAIDRAAMCAPMIAPYLRGLPKPVARLMCRAMKLAGGGKKRIFASKPYAGAEDFETAFATGRERFEWYDALRVATPAFHNNGPTYSWTLESIGVTDAILAPGAVERIGAKVRLYTAALDASVLPEPQAAFIARVRDGSRAVVEGAKHEIYRSNDGVLFPWWHEVLEFLRGGSDEP